MTPLAQSIAELIRAEGPITVARYMGECLGQSRHGYYMGRDPFGRAGDFITAPEISQMFGELIGAWCAAIWQQLGAPDAIRLVELGPGRGTLMTDLLRAGATVPGFVGSVTVHLVEISPALRAVQSQTLKGISPPLFWHDHLSDVPGGLALVIANEFFDCLPVRQYARAEDGWRERLIGLDRGGGLVFETAGAPLAGGVLPAWTDAGEIGTIAEISPARTAYAGVLGQRLQEYGGVSLIIDYGHLRSGLGDTLQAVRKHQADSVLAAPGDSDLTAHVDFAALGNALAAAGAAVCAPLTQSRFLTAIGLHEREDVLCQNADARQRVMIRQGAQRLAGDRQMGQLFKVLAATHQDLPAPAPFTTRQSP